MYNNDIDTMFATADDLKNAQPPQAIDKVRYYITAWLRSEWLKWFVYKLQSPLFEGKDLQELADVIQKLTIENIKQQDLTHPVRKRLINDIIQACDVCRKRIERK